MAQNGSGYWGDVPDDLYDYVEVTTAAPLPFECVPGWGGDHWDLFDGAASGVAVDADQNVYVFGRGAVPVHVFSPEGERLAQFGADSFDEPHSIVIEGERGYFVDRAHCIQVSGLDGEIDQTLGRRGYGAAPYSGAPFSSPTDLAVHRATGDLYVTDGYSNARVHRYSASGEHLGSIGSLGTLPGQFNVPHGIAFIDDDHFAVCDRENFRIQIFDLAGAAVDIWPAHRPNGIRRSPVEDRLYVVEAGPSQIERARLPNLGRRVVAFSLTGVVEGQFGGPFPGFGADQFVAPHCLEMDARGDIYVGEIGANFRGIFASASGVRPVVRKWRRTRAGRQNLEFDAGGSAEPRLV